MQWLTPAVLRALGQLLAALAALLLALLGVSHPELLLVVLEALRQSVSNSLPLPLTP